MTELERLNEAAEPLDLEFLPYHSNTLVFAAHVKDEQTYFGVVYIDYKEVESHQSEKSLRNLVRIRLRGLLQESIRSALDMLDEI